MKACFCTILTLLISTVPAFAVTINHPSNGETVTSPFRVSGSAATCSYQPVSAIGYSLDSGTHTTIVHEQLMNLQATASPGAHTVHVKVWGNKGAVCVKDVSVTVTSEVGSGGGPLIPADAVSVSDLQTLSNWHATHDGGTSGTAVGKMSLVGSPSHTGTTRQFVTTYTNRGGERYSLSFADDTTSTNFLYDGWVYIQSPSNSISNLEMDMNETMPNGQTVIFGFQCDGYSGTWDYSENLGTPEKPRGAWAHSNAACNPRQWSTNTWHHVQINYSRNETGIVTYQAVYLDGVKSTLNATVLAARQLGWKSALVTNFQVDGVGSSGSSTVYLDHLIIYRW